MDPIPSDLQNHMHNIIPKLFIGDFTSSQSLDLLSQHNIRNIVAAMKQSYPLHPGFESFRVPVDDTDKTNICGKKLTSLKSKSISSLTLNGCLS